MMKLRFLALLLAATLLAGGCAAFPAAEPATTPVIVLVDLSGSTASAADRYLALSDQVIASLKGGEHLMVLPVTGASLAAPMAIDTTLPAYRPLTTNSFTHGRRLKQLKESIRRQMSDLLTAPRTAASSHTAIIDGLMQAQDLLGGRPGRLVIISDMVEDSDLVRLDGPGKLNPEGLVDQIAQAGRLPTGLAGAQVHVAGIDGAAGLPADRLLAIRKFWELLFAKAGAQLAEYGPAFTRLDN